MAVLEGMRVADHGDNELINGLAIQLRAGRRRSAPDFRMRSRMARFLVARARKAMMKKKARRHSPKRGSLTQPLFTELKCLRHLVPYMSSKRENSCVITDAMLFLDQLTKQLDELAKPTIQVEVEPFIGQRFRIHVACKKRPGLMGDILALLEGLGFLFDNLNVLSVDASFTLDALITTTTGQAEDVSASRLKVILMRTLLIISQRDHC